MLEQGWSQSGYPPLPLPRSAILSLVACAQIADLPEYTFNRPTFLVSEPVCLLSHSLVQSSQRWDAGPALSLLSSFPAYSLLLFLCLVLALHHHVVSRPHSQ